MPRYCCFWCPSRNYDDRSLYSLCDAACGRHLGDPVFRPPFMVGAYVVEEPIGRGFYSSVYRATRVDHGQRYALKVSPTAVHEYFGKSLEETAAVEAAARARSPRYPLLHEVFTAMVHFSGSDLNCVVQVEELVEGVALAEWLAASPEPSHVGAVALQLLDILNELSEAHVFHNDLHDRNILIAAGLVRVIDFCEASRTVAIPRSHDAKMVAGHLESLSHAAAGAPALAYTLRRVAKAVSASVPGAFLANASDQQAAIATVTMASTSR